MRARREPGLKPLARMRRRLGRSGPADVEAERTRLFPQTR